MRLFGYPKDFDSEIDSEAEVPNELREATVAASPATLRRLAEFFLHVADRMERHSATFNHEHFCDYAKEMRSPPDIIVAAAIDGDD